MPLHASPGVIRAVDLLLCLATEPDRSFRVSELARRCDVPRATCNSLLMALEHQGLVQRDAALGYRLGATCLLLGDAARAASPALRAAAAEAEALAATLGAVTAVAMRDHERTRVVQIFDHGPAFGIRPRTGDSIPLVAPFGAAFVAWQSDETIDAWIARASPSLDGAQADAFRATLADVRERGYSVSIASDRQADLAAAFDSLARSSSTDDARARRDQAMHRLAHGEYLTSHPSPGSSTRLTQISAPVFDADGTVSVTIMLLGPAHELAAEEVIDLGERVRAAAARAGHDRGRRLADDARSG